MPRCSRCSEDLPAAEFNVCRRRKSGLQSRCRRCARKGTREAQRRLRQDPIYRQAEVERQNLAYRLNPDLCARKMARSRARRALETGKIVQKPCCACGRDDSEMHIPDPAKPLSVKWYCPTCRGLLLNGPDRIGVKAGPAPAVDPIAALLGRFDARHQRPPLKGPVKIRREPGRPRRVA